MVEGMTGDTPMSQSDKQKRTELLAEFLYWLFDSFIIPLISANFYVTESNVHRNKVFYFRHDLWRKLCEPVFSKMKTSMFEELPMKQAQDMLARRRLGYAQIRLLPKETGTRPIMNLGRRKALASSNGKPTGGLGPSINHIMRPVHTVLTYEKVCTHL